MRCSWSMLTVMTLFSTLAAAPYAAANLLTNGGLELPSPAPLGTSPFLIISAPAGDSLTLPGWTLLGEVDVVPSSYWEVPEGSYDVDTLGSPGLGSLQQTVTGLAPGATYSVSFELAINPANYRGESITTKRLQLTVTDANEGVVASQLYQGTAGSATRLNMDYTLQTLTFVADTPSETINFAALAPLNIPAGETVGDVAVGAVIDDVDLEFVSGAPQTPEPGTLGLLGVAGMVALRRRGGRGR